MSSINEKIERIKFLEKELSHLKNLRSCSRTSRPNIRISWGDKNNDCIFTDYNDEFKTLTAIQKALSDIAEKQIDRVESELNTLLK